MEKQIKDYLYLYIGCNVKVVSYPSHKFSDDAQLIGITPYEENVQVCYAENGDIDWINFGCIKPVLRPLSDMTVEERREIAFKKQVLDDINMRSSTDMDIFIMCGDISRYLLKQGFDLFGLISSGLAIDKTTLNN